MVIIETEGAAGLRDGPSGAPGPVPEPAPPSADLAADLRLVVGRLARSLRQADDGGLTPSQLSALSSIDALGSVRLGDLAAAERVTSPTLTKIVANLEAAGLVQRSADPDDRRAARVSLTPAGKSRLKRLRTERNAYLQQRLAALSASDRETLAAAIAVLTTLAETGRRVTAGTTSTFASLRQSRNYRLYFGGQAVSLAGTWMQTVAQGWLVLQLTGSSTLLGLVTACQFLPVTFLGPFGGVIVDRFDTRRLLIATQAAAGLLATLLGVLTVTGAVQLWMVFVVAVGLGMVAVVDTPARLTIVLELVGPELVSNAVTLNSINMNAARIVGPSLAAVTIALIGVGPCFLLNGASYIAVIVALIVLDRSTMLPKLITPRAKGQVREGLRYVRRTPTLRTPLLMMLLIGTLAYEFQVILPVMAEDTFHGDAGTYGVMTAAMGVGAVIGGLFVAGKSHHGVEALARVSVVFGVVIALLAVSPTLPVAVASLVLVGAASITFLARANTTLQLSAEPRMRGRVMALWTVAFLGSTPIGGPIIGFIGQYIGPRWALATASAACFGAAAIGASRAWSTTRRAAEAAPVTG